MIHGWAPKEGAALPHLEAPSLAPEPQGAPSTGPTAAGMSLAALQEIALNHNPTLAQAAMRIQAAQGGMVQAGLYPNPTVGYSGDEMGNEGTAGFQGAFVSQEFVTSGKLRLGRAVASHEVQQARWEWDAQRQRVLNDVRIAFYQALLAQRAIDLQQQLLGVSDESLRAAEQLKAAQEVGRADVLQSQIEAQTTRLALAEAKNRHWGAWRRLAALAGTPQMEPTALAGEPDRDWPQLAWDETVTRLLTSSPELNRARAGVDRARCELARQWAERVPNVGVRAGVQRDTISGYTVTNVEVGLPLPLFNRNQGNLMKAQAELTTAQNEVQRLELVLHDRLAAAYQRYANAREQAEAYRSGILPKAKESLELIRTGYRQGEFSYLTMLTAQRTYVQVNLSYLNAVNQLWTAAVELEGMLLRGGLGKDAQAETEGRE